MRLFYEFICTEVEDFRHATFSEGTYYFQFNNLIFNKKKAKKRKAISMFSILRRFFITHTRNEKKRRYNTYIRWQPLDIKHIYRVLRHTYTTIPPPGGDRLARFHTRSRKFYCYTLPKCGGTLPLGNTTRDIRRTVARFVILQRTSFIILFYIIFWRT